MGCLKYSKTAACRRPDRSTPWNDCWYLQHGNTQCQQTSQIHTMEWLLVPTTWQHIMTTGLTGPHQGMIAGTYNMATHNVNRPHRSTPWNDCWYLQHGNTQCQQASQVHTMEWLLVPTTWQHIMTTGRTGPHHGMIAGTYTMATHNDNRPDRSTPWNDCWYLQHGNTQCQQAGQVHTMEWLLVPTTWQHTMSTGRTGPHHGMIAGTYNMATHNVNRPDRSTPWNDCWYLQHGNTQCQQASQVHTMEWLLVPTTWQHTMSTGLTGPHHGMIAGT